jgi:hypothetical protein
VTVRVCIEDGCPVLTRSTRCHEHERAKDKARGTRQERGYDYAFEQAKLQPEYANATHCAECGKPFTEGNPKTGGHSVAIREGGRGSKVVPHCRRCNYGWRRTGL